MNENVFRAVGRRDEAETFAFVEPFNVTSDLAHLCFLYLINLP